MNTSVLNDSRQLVYSGLTERLIAEKLVAASAAAKIGNQAHDQGITTVQMLLDGEHVDSVTLARLVSEEYGVPLLDLQTVVDEQLPTDLVPQSLIRKHRALPLFRRGNRLFVAVADPTNKPAIDEFKFATGIATDTVVVEYAQLNRRIDEVIARQDEIFDGDISDFTSAEDYIPDLEV